MSSKIKAGIRIRPFLKSQAQNGYVNSFIRANKGKNQVQVREGQGHRKFTFDYIFDQQSTQADVYATCEIDHLIEKALKGYHATIFAYGQTGSGKTYTMHGDQLLEGNAQGIIPQLFKRIFEQIGQIKGRSFVVSLSFLQIYSQRVYDLLNAAGNARNAQQGLRIRWSKDQQFTVENLFVYQCQSAEDLMAHFRAGLKNRINAAHRLNLQSSRSHSILSVRIDSYDPLDSSSLLSSKIQLVDLAGSERIGLTGTEGRQAKESIDINKSLFTLRQVISVLAEGGKNKGREIYVPYRDSKLTSILKQSIGGNSYCLMLACICPHDLFLEQNMSTLTYATKASYITNRPTVNDDPRSRLVSELRQQVRALTDELARANEHIELVTNMAHSQQHRMVPSDPNIRRGTSERTSHIHSQPEHSQRLVESINMVRELLKSNKELREKLEQSNQRNDQKDRQIFELSRENQALRQHQQEDFSPEPASFTHHASFTQHAPISRRRQVSRGGSQLQHHNTEHLLGGMTGSGGKGAFNYWNSVEINQYYMNERGVDSVPTNFTRREAATSHQRRQPRASTGEKGRNSYTAKFNSRTWKNINNDSSCKLQASFHDSPDIY